MRSPFRGLALTDRWFNRLVVCAVSLGFLALILAGIAATLTIIQTEKQTNWVNHTYQVERSISRFRVLEERLEAARRGYLLLNEAGLSATFRNTAAAIEPALQNLKKLTQDNPAQQANIDEAERLTHRHLATLDRSVALVTSGHRDEAIAAFNSDESLPMIRAIRAATERMIAVEDRLLAERNAAQEASLRLFFGILIAAGVILLVVAGSSIWVILRYTRDLTKSRDELQKLNSNLEGAVRERTVDLQRANEEIQRFAYIVSHDLRSPLVNVMGFTAELESAAKSLSRMVDQVEEAVPDKVEREWADAARVDLPEAIGFIRTSTQKMDRLINAILRLSREGRRPITPERLALSPLLQSIADSMKHRIDELGAKLIVWGNLPEIVSDRVALEQIFSNLMENATKYLKRDMPGHITVGGRLENGRVLIDVVDNGRGIDPKDHERIFDLFRRSGVQDQPGEGIGLAHTRALAYRLGGTITVESRLGEGATFRVNLPRIYSGEQGAAT